MQCHFENNRIEVEIEVSSLLSPEILKRKITGIVDTGFTGDLQLTYDVAFPLGLTLKGFQAWKVADGSTVNFLDCLGWVALGGSKVISSIDVKPAGLVLIGMSLLRKLGCEMKIDFASNIAEINVSGKGKKNEEKIP